MQNRKKTVAPVFRIQIYFCDHVPQCDKRKEFKRIRGASLILSYCYIVFVYWACHIREPKCLVTE